MNTTNIHTQAALNRDTPQRGFSMIRTKQMRIWSHTALALFFFTLVGIVPFLVSSPAAAATCSYPAQVLNLTNWKETLPIGSSHSPTEIKMSALTTFVHNLYFRTNPECSGVVFRAPVNGVTTSGSGYPRSELREMTSDGTVNASWSTTSGTHSMIIDEAITAVPKAKKHVVAAQIHDASDDVIVIRLEYPKLFVDINGKTGPTLDANYTLGKRFVVKFVASSGKINIYYNGSTLPVYTLAKRGSGNYFKAGAYTQSNCSKETVCDASNYGEVVVYSLLVQHGDGTVVTSPVPTPTPTPALTPTSSPVPTPAPQAITETSFEAEAGTVKAPMQILSDMSALGGKYIVQTDDTGTGSAQYAVTVPSAGQYQIRAKVIAPNGSSNSIYFAVDSNSMNTWSFPDTLTNWAWVDGPTIALSQGDHTLTIKKREKGTKIDALELKSLSNASSSAVDGIIPLEAESGIISGGMQVLSDDSSASSGKYIAANASGSVSYQISVLASGTYRVAGWIKTIDESSDSFSLVVDSSSAKTWTLASPAMTWTYDVDDSHTFMLGAGTHTVVLKYREAGAKIDKLVLVKQ